VLPARGRGLPPLRRDRAASAPALRGLREPSGRPSRGGKALLGLRNGRGKDQPVYCMDCHPELGGTLGTLAMLERMGA
jgi:hypothetical protein